MTNATGGTFTLTFNGQTTAPVAFNATAAQIDTTLEALSNIGTNNIQTSGGPVNTANVNVFFRRALQQSDQSADDERRNRADRHDADRDAVDRRPGWLVPAADRRRPPLDPQHERPPRQGAADQGQGRGHHRGGGERGRLRRRRRVHDPGGEPLPAGGGLPQDKTRPEVYAMGFQNPFRLQVDENDVAYVTDYSPDAQTPRAAAAGLPESDAA